MDRLGEHVIDALNGFSEKGIDYFPAIRAFARQRLASMARSVIHGLQRVQASGVAGDDYSFRTLWDEVCWYVQSGSPIALLDHAFESTLDPFFRKAVGRLGDAEVVLLSCAVAEDQRHMPARSDDEIMQALRAVVRAQAADRDLSRFEAA